MRFWGALFCASVMVMPMLSGAAQAQQENGRSAPFPFQGGQAIFTGVCQGCHMPGAQGATGAGFYPKLAGDKKLVAWQFVALTVLNGRNGMPPFGFPADQVVQLRTTHLSDQQVADVVNYLRSHFNNKFPATVTAAQVAALPHPVTGTKAF